MASYDDILNDDPINFGMMQAAQALLTPRARGGGLGAAFGSFGSTVSRERQNQIENQLKKDLIESRRRDRNDPLKRLEGLPAKVREVEWYTNVATPEQRQMYQWALRQSLKQGKDGILYRDTPEGLVPLTDFEKTLVNMQQMSGATTRGSEIEKLRMAPPVERWDPNTQKMVLVPPMEEYASRGGFQSMPPAGMPTQGPAGGPAAFPPKLIPELPPGTTPQHSINGMSVPELVQRERAMSSPYDAQGNLVTQRMLTEGLPSNLQPASMGAPTMNAQKVAEQKRVEYEQKLKEGLPQAKGAFRDLENTTESALRMVDKIKKNELGEYWNTGLISNLPTHWIKGTAPFQHDADLQSLRDRMVIQTIAKLKELSATGATGFGQLSEKEGARLENAMAMLVRGQDPKSLRNALAEIEDALKNIRNNSRQVFNDEFGRIGERMDEREKRINRDSPRNKLRIQNGLPPIAE